DERKDQTVLLLERARRRQLTRRVIEPDHAGAAPREPRRPVGGATAELDDIAVRDRRQRAHLSLGKTPDAPRRLGLAPGATARLSVVHAEPVPDRAVLLNVP